VNTVVKIELKIHRFPFAPWLDRACVVSFGLIRFGESVRFDSRQAVTVEGKDKEYLK